MQSGTGWASENAHSSCSPAFVSFVVTVPSLEFVTAFSKLQRWRSVIPYHPQRKLYDKKEVFNLPFMVTFTVKVLICIDMFLKCCAKLKLNTWVRPSGFKDPAKGQRDGGRPADRSMTLLFFMQPGQCRNEICLHILSTRPTPSAEDFIYLCIWDNHEKTPKHSWLMLTDEKTFKYTRNLAIIFSCLVHFRPVGAGRIFALW